MIMFHSSINYLLFSLIFLLLILSGVNGYCNNQRTCFSEYSISTWCCDWSDTCGSDDGSCESDSALSTALIAMTIIGVIFFFVLCLICCLRTCQRQRVRTIYTDSNGQIVTHPSQHHSSGSPVRVVHVGPVYSIESSPPLYQYPSLYEEPPPSYESATANLPTVHPSSTQTV